MSAAGTIPKNVECRVAAADVGRIDEDLAKALVERAPAERGVLVRNRDEAGPRSDHSGLPNAAFRLRRHGSGFDRRPRSARQHEQRRRRLLHRGSDRFGINGIEYLKPREPGNDTDDDAQHFRRETRAAHPVQDDVGSAAVSDQFRERAQSRQGRTHDGGQVDPAETAGDRLLHRTVGAPLFQPARPQCVRKPVLFQPAVGVLESDVDCSWIDREGHEDTMNLTRMPRMLRSLIASLTLIVMACAQAEAPRPEAASRAAAQVDAQPERLASPPRIVFLGDSLTAGLGLPREQSVPSLIQERLRAEGYPYEVVNAGVSGDTSAGGVSRLDWSLEGDVRILVIELGANDGLRGLPVSQMKRNLGEIITRSQQRGITVILTGMEAPPNYGIVYISEFRRVFRDLADQHDVLFVPFFLEGVAGVRSLNNSDGMHPNAAGARVVAETVWRALEPALEQQDR